MINNYFINLNKAHLDTANLEIINKTINSAIFNITKQPKGGFDNITILCSNNFSQQVLCENLTCSCSNLIPGTKYNVVVLTNKNNNSRRNDIIPDFYTGICNFFILK